MHILTVLFRLAVVALVAVNILFDVWSRKNPQKLKKWHLIALSALIVLFWVLLIGPIICDWYLYKTFPTTITSVASIVVLIVFSGPAVYTCFRLGKLFKSQK